MIGLQRFQFERRVPTLACFLWGLALSGLLADWATAEPSTRELESADRRAPLAPSPAEAQRRLNLNVDGDFIDLPVRELSSRLEELAGIMVMIDPRALREDEDKTVSLQANRVPLAEALDALLDPIGWYWSLKGATLYLTSNAAPGDCFSLRLYDVRDLADRGDDRHYDRYDVEQFSDIPDILDRNSWTSEGGRGNVRAISGPGRVALAVYQTDSGHRRFAELLSQLHRVPQSRTPQPLPIAANQLANRSADRSVGPAPEQARLPHWWVNVAASARRELCPMHYSWVWPPTRPEASPRFSICGGCNVGRQIPYDTQLKLLAWYAAEDDAPLVKIQALVWGHSKSARMWELAVYTWRPLSLPESPGSYWVNSSRQGPYPSPSGLFRRAPRDRDVREFLHRLSDPWQFENRRGSRLLAGNVRVDEWRDATGEDPTRFYSAALPRTYELPPVVRAVQQQAGTWERLTLFEKKALGLDLNLRALQDGVEKLRRAVDWTMQPAAETMR